LFWIEDRSDGFRDTSAFIDRRIENIMHIQKLRGALKDKFEGVGGEFVRGFTKH
jgi:ubiquinone biosynthesis protein COQ9